MPLPTGTISISQINAELSRSNSNSSLRTLSAAIGRSAPDAMSEFHGYSSFFASGGFYYSSGGSNYHVFDSPGTFSTGGGKSFGIGMSEETSILATIF
jgi:hypothetical protein